MRSEKQALEPSPDGGTVIDLTQRVASEEELMRRTAEGDEDALAELVRRGGELPEPARAA